MVVVAEEDRWRVWTHPLSLDVRLSFGLLGRIEVFEVCQESAWWARFPPPWSHYKLHAWNFYSQSLSIRRNMCRVSKMFLFFFFDLTWREFLLLLLILFPSILMELSSTTELCRSSFAPTGPLVRQLRSVNYGPSLSFPLKSLNVSPNT